MGVPKGEIVRFFNGLQSGPILKRQNCLVRFCSGAARNTDVQEAITLRTPWNWTINILWASTTSPVSSTILVEKENWCRNNS